MGKDAPKSIVLDTNVLINFMNVKREDLLFRIPHHRFFVTNVVRAELSRPEQAATLEAAISAGALKELVVLATDPVYAELRVRLDDGESSAMAAAIGLGYSFATDELAAKKLAARRFHALDITDTPGLVVAMIHAGLLSVDQADTMKNLWEKRYRFTLKIRSFEDLLGSAG